MNPHHRRISIRRPILAVAALLTVLMIAGAAYLGRRAGDGIAEAARADGEALAREALLAESLSTANAIAERLARALTRARGSAERLAGEVRRLGSTPLPPPLAPRDATGAPRFERVGAPGVLVSADRRALAPYRVAPPDAGPDQLRALTARMNALDAAWRVALDADETTADLARGGVTHVAVWVDGEGLIGHPLPPARQLVALGGRHAPLGPDVLGGESLFSPTWVGPHARLSEGRVLSHVVPVADRHGRRFAVVAADLDFATVEAALAALDDGVTERVLLDADGDPLAASPEVWEALAATPETSAPTSAERDVVDALWADSPAVIARVPVAETGWTVAVVAAPDTVALRAGVASAAGERAARAVGSALLGYGLFFGTLTALAALLLSHSLLRRLRPLIRAVAAHAVGDLDHRVEVLGRDELATLAEGMNDSAHRLRANLQKLRESKRRLAGLIEHMGNGLVVTDAADRITFVNPRFAEMVQRSPDDLKGRDVQELLRPESKELYRTEIARRREGHSGQYEVTWAVPGVRRPRTIVSGMPLYDEDDFFCGSFGVVTDITSRDQVQAESARARKLRALGAMAGGVAHDFNHVLTIVLGNAQLLTEEDLPEDVMDTVRSIERAALDGAERIRRVREFTKLRSAVNDGDVLDPNDLVRDVALRAREQLEARPATEAAIELRIRPLAHRSVRGNASELREALGNVVTNAIQALPDGGVLVIECFDRGEDAVGLRVEDDGIGMRPEDVDRVFDPFFTTRDTTGSSGLGLSIAFGIARAHGGRIDVRSQPDEGSAITLVLPTHRVTGEVSLEAPTQPRVLYATRSAESAKPMQQALQKLGLYVAVMESYRSTVAVLGDAAIFNTLLLEHDLGEHNGWELARLARRARPEIRIVLLSEIARSPSESQAHNAGIDRLLVRPFDPRDVHAAIMSAAAAPPASPVVLERATPIEDDQGPDKRTMTATGEVVLATPKTGAVYAEPDDAPES